MLCLGLLEAHLVIHHRANRGLSISITHFSDISTDKMASTLSPELMSMICAYLDHRDIKTGRLVSRQWDAAAKQKLFSRVNLKFNALSFDRLRLILGRVSLAFHVKTLHYDVRRLPRGIDRLDDWLDFAGNGWTISGRHNEKAYWQQLKQQEGHGNDLVYFERTRQLFKEQQGLCAGSVRICREYMLLRDVIMKCSQLRTLSFESGVENDWKIIHWQPGCGTLQLVRSP